MKMMISRDRLREKIMGDPDVNTEAGFSTYALEGIGMFLSPDLSPSNDDQEDSKLKLAFGVLIRQLRRSEHLSQAELAMKARIEEIEVCQIEADPKHKPRPRTVHQLAGVFKIPERALMKLSGATITNDNEFQEEAYRFAAKSDSLDTLSAAERKELSSFIKFLADHNGD